MTPKRKEVIRKNHECPCTHAVPACRYCRCAACELLVALDELKEQLKEQSHVDDEGLPTEKAVLRRQQRSEWNRRVAKCWPEILAVVEAAELATRRFHEDDHEMGQASADERICDALDKKAGEG